MKPKISAGFPLEGAKEGMEQRSLKGFEGPFRSRFDAVCVLKCNDITLKEVIFFRIVNDTVFIMMMTRAFHEHGKTCCFTIYCAGEM